MTLLLFMTTTLLGAEARKEEEIVIFFDKEKTKEEKNFFQKAGLLLKENLLSLGRRIKDDAYREVDNLEPKAQVEIGKFEYTSIGLDLGIKNLKPEEIHHDISKLYRSYDDRFDKGVTNWNKFRFSTSIALPLNARFDNVLGPLGFHVGTAAGRTKKYTLITKGKTALDHDQKIVRRFFQKVGDSFVGLGSIRIPLNLTQLVRKYPAGSEISTEGIGHLSFNTGVSLGIPIVNANARLVSVVSGYHTKTIKVLNSLDTPFVSLTISRTKRKERKAGSDLGVGITLFEIEFGQPDYLFRPSIAANLRVNFINSVAKKSTEDRLLYEFMFDPSYEEASLAFSEAMKGNLIPAQELAVVKFSDKGYRGVLQVMQANDLIINSIRSRDWGLVTRGSSIGGKSLIPSIRLREKLGNWLHFHHSSLRYSDESLAQNFYHNVRMRQSSNYHKKRASKAIWGRVWSKDHEIKVHNKWVDYEKVTEDGEFSNHHTYFTDASYHREQKLGGRKAFNRFLSNASLILRKQKIVYNVINRLRETKECKGKLSVSYRVKLFEEGYDYILSLSKRELYTLLGNMLRVKSPELLYLSSYRKLVVKKIKDYLQTDAPFSASYSKRYISWFDKKFLRHLDTLKTLESVEKIDELTKLYEKFRFHLFPSIFMGYVLIEADKNGFLMDFEIKSKTCAFKWRVLRYPKYIDLIHDESSDAISVE